MATVYLNRQGVANLLGVSRQTVRNYRLPEPDAIMDNGGGKRYDGWTETTILAWHNGRNPKRLRTTAQ